MVPHFHNSNCAYNGSYNLHQKSVPLLQPRFTSLFHPYLLTNSSLQSLLKLPCSIPQQYFTSLFLRTAIPTIYIKNIFPTSTIYPSQATSGDQGAMGSCEEWHCFNLFLLPQSMNIDNRTACHVHVIIISRTRLRVNLHFIVAWMPKNSLLETSAASEA